MNLRIPGPVPLPAEIAKAMQKPMIDHRGPEFAALLLRVTAALKRIFQTDNDLLIFTSSGTGALEAALVNTISPGDHVLAFSAGAFGDKFAQMARAFGAAVTQVDFEWGSAIEPERVARAVRENSATRAVLVTHNETSTGVLHPLQNIARAVRENSDAVLIVDAVSSLGAVKVQTDAWGIDLIATAAQKAWACPPGLAMVSISPRAWKAAATAKTPRYYFDFAEMKKWTLKGQTPFTPAVLNYYALDQSVAMIEAEGIANVYARHARIAQRVRDTAKRMGFALVAEERFASPTATALTLPQGIQAEDLRRVAREEFGLVIAGGQGKLSGKIIRIGHLGWVSEEEIDRAMRALDEAMEKVQ